MNQSPRRPRFGLGVAAMAIAGAVSLLIATEASAQLSRPGGLGQPSGQQQQQQSGRTGLHPPAPQRPDAPPRWLYYGVMLILGGATIAVGIMPAKRSAQD